MALRMRGRIKANGGIDRGKGGERNVRGWAQEDAER